MDKHNELQTVINDFFDFRNFMAAHNDLQTAIQAADSQEEWNGGSPAHLNRFFNGLHRLLEIIIRFKNDERCRVANINGGDEKIWKLGHEHLFCNADAVNSPWDEFPRYLNRVEFLEPSLVFSKCSSFQFIDDWNVMFRHFIEYALSKKAIREIYPNTNFFKISTLLHKLIDAIHLVKVRSQAVPPGLSNPGKKYSEPAIAKNAGNETSEAESWDFINAFFRHYELENARSALWNIIKRAITNPSADYDASGCTNMIDLYEELLVLLEKTCQLNRHNQQLKNQSLA